jgi:hypothetical protein
VRAHEEDGVSVGGEGNEMANAILTTPAHRRRPGTCRTFASPAPPAGHTPHRALATGVRLIFATRRQSMRGRVCTNDRRRTVPSTGGSRVSGSRICAETSRRSSILSRQSRKRRFAPRRYSSFGRSADSASRRKQTKQRSWPPSMTSPGFRVDCSLRSNQAGGRGTARRKLPRQGRAQRNDSKRDRVSLSGVATRGAIGGPPCLQSRGDSCNTTRHIARQIGRP